jgi:hypothetical protein
MKGTIAPDVDETEEYYRLLRQGVDLWRDMGEAAVRYALKHGAHGALKMTREAFESLFLDTHENLLQSALPMLAS